MKTFSKIQTASIKRTAQTTFQLLAKLDKLEEKIDALMEEKRELDEVILAWESPIIKMTGYESRDLIEKKVVESNGIKAVKWEFKYPDTIIPVEEDVEIQNTVDTEVIDSEFSVDMVESNEDYFTREEAQSVF